MAQFSTAFTNPTLQNASASLGGAGALASTSTTKPAAAKSTVGKNRFVYPLQRLENSSDYLEIKIVSYVPPGIQISDSPRSLNLSSATAKIKNQKEKPLYYIHLPIPQSLTDNNSVTWGDDSLNPLEAFGLSESTKIMQGGPEEIPAAIERLVKSATNAAQMGGAQDLFISALAGKAVGSLGGNVSAQSILGRATGQILNPNLELLFEGVNLRTFPFVFDFAPRDEKEAEEVKNIIRVFKKSMTAKTTLGSGAPGIGLFVRPPDVFQLTFKSGKNDHPFLNKFKPAALIDMSLNYTASGTYATYTNGTPVHIQMTLTFKELNPIYAEDYNVSEPGVGY